MSTVLPPSASSAIATSVSGMDFSAIPWRLHRFTVAEYQRFVMAGMFGEDDPVELLEGWVVEKMPKNPRHDSTVDRMQLLLNRILPKGWYVRCQNSLVTPDSVPEPEGAVVRGTADDYDDRHPEADDTLLVIEVAETSVHLDREKARLYAKAGIPEYWIINLKDRQVEIHRNPELQQCRYADQVVVGELDDVELVLPTGERLAISMAQILPKVTH